MRNDDLIQLGKIIRKAREDHNWTQKQLSEAVDLTGKYISAIENGKRNISYGVLCRIIIALQIPASKIFGISSDIDQEAEERLIQCYRSCPVQHKPLVCNITEFLVNELRQHMAQDISTPKEAK